MNVQNFMSQLAQMLNNSNNNTVVEEPKFQTVSLKDFTAGKQVSLHQDDERTTNDGSKKFTSYGIKVGNTVAQFSSQISHEDNDQRIPEFRGMSPEQAYDYLKAHAADFDVMQKRDRASKCLIMRQNGEPVLTIVKHSTLGKDLKTETW